MNILLKTLKNYIFKTWSGWFSLFFWIILPSILIIVYPIINLSIDFIVQFLIYYFIINSSIGTMPGFIFLIKKSSFIKKFFLIKKTRIKNFLPVIYFFIFNLVFFFILFGFSLLIYLKDIEQITIFFKKINIFEFLYSLIIFNIICLLIGQLLYLYIKNFNIFQLLSIILFGISLGVITLSFLPHIKIKFISEISYIHPLKYVGDLFLNSLNSNVSEKFNINGGGIFDLTKNFIFFNINTNKFEILFTKEIKILNLIIPILFILLILPFTILKKIELDFDSKNIFKNNFKRTNILNTNSKSLIEIKNLSKTFKRQTIFKDLSFSINKGEIIGILGKNGVGKTTFFKSIIGLGNADEGKINYNFKYKKNQCENMDFLLQEIDYLTELKVKDVLNSLIHKNIDKNFINKLKNILEIEKIFNKKISTMSGGEKQRFSFFISIMEKPNILFLDEFTNNLDIKFKFNILNFLKDYFKNENKACVIITHDIYVLQKICSRVVLFQNNQFTNLKESDINMENISKIID